MPLPSCRILAEKLGVARGTVVLAFQQLVDQGFLIAKERRGHFVNPEVLTSPAKPSQRQQADSETIDWKARRRVPATDLQSPSRQVNWIKYSYPFVYGQFDPALFPTAEWRECNRMALAVLEIRNWAADMVDRDDPLLIEQVQARLLPRRGIFANPDEIIITLGAQNALYMLATLLMSKGSKVAMEEPGYPDARSIFNLAGAETVPVRVDAEGIVADEVPPDCGFVFVTPSHHCPTMVPLSGRRRQQLLADAAERDQIVIEDGYDSQLLDDAPQQALKSLDRGGRVVYVGSMSKTLAPGLRIGYIVAPADLIAELRALRRFMLRHPPANNQRAVALFLSLGHHEALVRRLSAAFGERRRRLIQAVNAFLPEWRATDSAGGASVWLEGPAGMDTAALAETAAARSVVIEPGGRFFARGERHTQFMRLGISSIALQHIEPGIRELATAAGRRPAAA
jgi:GntR family transcriptional regulator/MocR family aminotransferase